MKKNIFDKMSDSYENFHLKDTELRKGNSTITISSRLKLALGWSLFILCCIVAYAVIGSPFQQKKVISEEEKKSVLEQKVDVDEEHDTIVPYEKDAEEELNAFIESYLNAITTCDNLALQDMVTNPDEYNDAESLKKKAEFITGYSNITVYTKAGLDEGSYVAFVVTNVIIAGVNSSPYDIITLYIVDGARGYLINNGTLSEDAQAYIEKIKGDKDIQKIYRSVEKKNNELKEEDSSLQEFYEIISRRNVETNSVADQLTTEAEQQSDDGQPANEEQSQTDGQQETEAGQNQSGSEQQPEE